MMRKPFHISIKDQKKAILIDPEKEDLYDLPIKLESIRNSSFDFILLGGSTVSFEQMEACGKVFMEAELPQPVLLFPGAAHQVNPYCDGLLFLSLISGDNPEFLIGQQRKSVRFIEELQLPVMSIGYMLMDGGNETAVSRISKTQPINQDSQAMIRDTAIAGEFIGMKAIYMDAGSGAKQKVRPENIELVCKSINIPLIVGGGLRSKEDINLALQSGANLVVIGNHIENHPELLKDF